MPTSPRHAVTDALIVIDMLSRYDFPDAEDLASVAAGVMPSIRRLLDEAADTEIPVIYVNDNYGDWTSSAEELLAHALDGEHPELIEPLRPPDGAKFVIKARHSIFYGTPLEYLLKQLRVDRIILCGQVTEQCVLYSALDAYVREFEVVVPRDAVAHIHADLADAALRMMQRNMRAQITDAASACRLPV